VLEEIARGDPDVARRRLDAVCDFAVLAFAARHGITYLVSWNCAHIVTARTRIALDAVNALRGIVSPELCTPEELMEV